MANKSLMTISDLLPGRFDDFFKPWNEWFSKGGSLWQSALTVPAVNITENKDSYEISLAVPGMKKDDFMVEVNGNIMTISCEKEEKKEEKEQKYARKEYNYSSFSRSFALPEEVDLEKIDARYADGILKLALPRKAIAKTPAAKSITVN